MPMFFLYNNVIFIKVVYKNNEQLTFKKNCLNIDFLAWVIFKVLTFLQEKVQKKIKCTLSWGKHGTIRRN